MSTVINSQTITDEFRVCWNAAGRHLSRQSDAPIPWIKASLKGLVMEHFSFRLGNQIFFIQVDDVDGNLDYPSTREGFIDKAKAWKGHPCLMPMKIRAGEWQAILPNWGLQHAITGELIIPPALISNEEIEITEDELQDFAVQVVRNVLNEEGREVTESQSDLRVNPSIWFVDEDKLSWVVVRAVRYPERKAAKPANLNDIAINMAAAGHKGYFASVAVANANDPFISDPAATGNYLPLIRGEGNFVFYEGLEPVMVR